MSGNRIGGLKARDKNLQRDPDFYSKIGARGGANGNTGGFYYSKMHGLTTHIEAGRKGGSVSRRKEGESVMASPARAQHWYDNLIGRKQNG